MDLTELLESGGYGPKLTVRSAWSDNLTSFCREHGIVELELNMGKGWMGGPDLTFLKGLHNLRAFCISDVWTKDVSPIHSLHELESLTVWTWRNTPLLFENFPKLRKCVFEWRSKFDTFFDCVSLQDLMVYAFKGKDTSLFSRLTNLRSLAIYNSPIADLSGLSSLKKLKKLDIALLCKLPSLAGIENLLSLEELRIDTSRKLTSIAEVSNLTNLRILDITNCGDIESLKPLRKLHNLEECYILQSTNIVDGDLSVLKTLPKLREHSFAERKHYSHNWADFGKHVDMKEVRRQIDEKLKRDIDQ